MAACPGTTSTSASKMASCCADTASRWPTGCHRRAELPTFYSQGFRPKPEMTFGPALALGIATLDEYIDVKLAIDVDPERLPALLQPGAPEGLVFRSAARLGAEDPTISKVVDTT